MMMATATAAAGKAPPLHRPSDEMDPRQMECDPVLSVPSTAISDEKENNDYTDRNYGIDEAYRCVKDILEQITFNDSPPINEEQVEGFEFHNYLHPHQRKSPNSNTSCTASLSTASNTTGHARHLPTASTSDTTNSPTKMNKRYSRQQHVLPGSEAPTSPRSSVGSSGPHSPCHGDVSLEGASTLSSLESLAAGHHDTASLWMAQYQQSQSRAEMKMGNVSLATLCVRTLDSIDAGIATHPELSDRHHVQSIQTEHKTTSISHSSPKPKLKVVTDTDELKKSTPRKAWKRRDPPSLPEKSWNAPWRKTKSPNKMPSPPGVIANDWGEWSTDVEKHLDDLPATPVRANTNRELPVGCPVDPSPKLEAAHSGDSTDAIYTGHLQEDNQENGCVYPLLMDDHDDNHSESNDDPYSPGDMEYIAEETEDDIAHEQGRGANNRKTTPHGASFPKRNLHLDTKNGGGAARPEVSPRRFQMYGSEYARFLSTSPLAPDTHPKSKRKPGARYGTRAAGSANRATYGSRPLNIEDADNPALTGAITDIVVTHGSQLPPKGFYRISQTGEGDEFTALKRSVHHGGVTGLIPGRRSTQVFINVKKEPNWDRAAQRPCVTALAVIFPDKKEFVPPGFCVVRRYKGRSVGGNDKLSSGAAADLNFGSTGERVFLCYRRSREGNPITGVFPLQPLNNETIPEGYTVMEKTPRNHVADINSNAGPPVFLAFRQRLASLEPLRPLPLVLSVHAANPLDNQDEGSLSRRMRQSSKEKSLRAYYCTGGTIVSSEVGRFHIMDRTTHSLLSPSSVTHRLSLIEASRQRAGKPGTDLHISRAPTYASSTCESVSDLDRDELVSRPSDEFDETSSAENSLGYSNANLLLNPSMSTLSGGSQHCDEYSLGSNQASTVSSARLSTSAANVVNQTLFSINDAELQRCLDALNFIPVVVTASGPWLKDDEHLRMLQARVAALTPILTACYTHHGGSALIAVEGLTTLLTITDFFRPDICSASDISNGTSSRLTLFDLAIQAVCDVATCTCRETSFGVCVDFVQYAVEYSQGQLNPRTIGYILRFYLFVFYFGASTPNSSRGVNPVWMPNSRDQRESSADRSVVALHDLPLLYDDTPPEAKKVGRYLPGGAPQASALALKELISLTIRRLSLMSANDAEAFGRDLETARYSEPFGEYIQDIISSLIDVSVHRVDLANYTQLALHQIHRSGGTELFWFDMLKSCGVGLFSTAGKLPDELKSGYIVTFAVLANLVKVSSGTIRHIPDTNELVPRDVATKLLSLELIHHFILLWKVDPSHLERGMGLPSAGEFPPVETMAFSIRRLVVPCLLRNVECCLEDGRVFRRVMWIISELWRSPYYRRHMKMEIGVLVNQFALRILRLGPQIFSPNDMGILEGKASNESVSAPSPTHATDTRTPLLSQQIDLLFEIRRWFGLNESDVVEFYLNFDINMSNKESVMSQMLPGTQWRLCQQLCAAICTIAEQSGDILCQQICASKMSSTVPPPSPTAATASVFFGSQGSLEGSGELRDKMMREGSRHLQHAAFDALTQILKNLTNSASIAMGARYRALLTDWEGQGEIDVPVDESDLGFSLSSPAPVRPICNSEQGYSSPTRSLKKAWKNRPGKRDDDSIQDRHRLPEPTDGGDGIVDYWQSAIAAERRKAAPASLRPVRKNLYSTPQNKGGANVSAASPRSSSSTAVSRNGKVASPTVPNSEEILPVAFDIAKTKSLKKAIDYLIACDFLTPSPRNVAAFLRLHRAQFDASSLGVFLAEGGKGGETDYWNQIRFNYIRPISFVGMNVEQGLRHFLTDCGFRLPGEAQQIDRIMTTFSQCFWEDNAGDLSMCPFQDQDTVFLLAFAIIMLNTDLHKSNASSSSSRKQRKKMTKLEFLNNLRGVDVNEDISKDYLSEVYDSIEAHPISMLIKSDDSVAGSLGFSFHEAAPVQKLPSLEGSLTEAVKNAKLSEELLRGMSVHVHPFYTVDDFGRSLGYSGRRDALADVARSVIATTWHHFHGLIHAVLDAAHLDPRGMEMSLDLLQYALCITICLDMPMERSAFTTQLARFKMFRELRGNRFSTQVHQAYKSEEWYVRLESNCSDPKDDDAKLFALADVRDMIQQLHDSLRIDVNAKREMNCVVRRIRQGEFLLNDPTRFFLREGDLAKRGSRMGRSTKYRFFLFSDVMIYAKASTSTDDFKIHEELPLHLMKITDWFPDNRQQMKTAFQIHHPRKSFIVFAESVEDRQSWVKDIREAIKTEVERLTTLENARIAAASVER